MKASLKLPALLTALFILTNCLSVFSAAVDDLQGAQSPRQTWDSAADSGAFESLEEEPQDSGWFDRLEEEPRDSGEPIPFTIQLVSQGESPGIYGTLAHLPEGTTGVSILYSFGGEQFDFIEDTQWDYADTLEGRAPLTQLCIPMDTPQLSAYAREVVNSIYIRLQIEQGDNEYVTTTGKISHNNTYPVPETPLPYSARIELDYMGFHQITGTFSDFPPNTARVRPMYSLDGVDYQAISAEYPNDWHLNSMGTEEETSRFHLENQYCALSYHEPLKGYRGGTIDRFYTCLRITTEDGEEFDTQPVLFEHGDPQPLPVDTTVEAAFPFTMRVPDHDSNPAYPYGQYQITVRENATPEEMQALLPGTLPIEVRFLEKDTHKLLTWGKVYCPVEWKPIPSLTLTAGETTLLPHMAERQMVPAGTQVVTPLGIYILPEPLFFDHPGIDDQVRLAVHVVSEDQPPDVSLRENELMNSMGDYGTLQLAFRQKPSGATSIKAYSFVDEENEGTEICDLLDRKALDYNQSAALYGFVKLLEPGDSPLVDYTSGGIPGFSIELRIEGGTFDGERVLLPWPGEYDPPDEIHEPDSSEGNPGNAGSEDGDDGDDGDEDGGQRPNLPGGGTTGGGSGNGDTTQRPKPPKKITPPTLEIPIQPMVTEDAPAPPPMAFTAQEGAPADPPAPIPQNQPEPEPQREPQAPGEQASATEPVDAPLVESEKTSPVKSVVMMVLALSGGGIALAGGRFGLAGIRRQ